ncbi:alpha/beta hydrolase [Halobacteriales archaeon QH_7_66_36]|nr:MAG: alpha/beta hydrolase [Halobacteriales archaeon QH_7_66_36]
MPLAQYGDPEVARDVAAQMRADAEGPALGDIENRAVPGPDGDVPIRVYRPEGDGPRPTVLYFHGGGWVIGDLESHDLACRHLAVETGCTVVAVDYRRAPEHPYPAALEDCYAVTEWVAENPDAVGGDGRLAVAGDSAGGNLAAAVCLRARDENGPDIAYQALVYPAVSPSDDWDSRRENGEGYYLTEPDMEWFGDCYFDEDDESDPYAFPMVADSHADLPPASVHRREPPPLPGDDPRVLHDARAAGRTGRRPRRRRAGGRRPARRSRRRVTTWATRTLLRA